MNMETPTRSVTMEPDMLALFELTPDLVCIAGKDGYFKKVNPAVTEKLGFTAQEIYARPIATFIHPDDRELTARVRQDLLRGKNLQNFQNRYCTRTGETLWLQWTSVYIPAKEVVFAIAKDISETKRKEKEIEEKARAYKNMASHFKDRAERDRRYMASELHEEVAQLAAALKLDLQQLKKDTGGSMPVLMNEKLDDALVVTDMLIRTIRQLCFNFHPGMLDDFGFHATMEWMCKEFSQLNGAPCSFYSDISSEHLLPETQTDFFRFCQEALQNVMDHAEAGEVWVSLRNREHEWELSVTDNGKGFVESGMSGQTGLQHMQQLATTLGARFVMESAPGQGTRVALYLGKKTV